MERRQGTAVKSGKRAEKSNRLVPGWIGLAASVGVFGALLWLEHRRPLRRATESSLPVRRETPDEL